MPFRDYPALNAMKTETAIQQVFDSRKSDQIVIEQLERGKFQGRYRTGQRAVPTSSTDVTVQDFVGDMINDGSFLYILLDISGSIEWRRLSISSF